MISIIKNGVHKKYISCVLYKPMQDEVNFNEPNFPIQIPKDKIILSQNPKNDPFKEALKCIRQFEGKEAFVLVPGREFDIYGNRKGRGFGWYDRFLSKIPNTWLKIGVLSVDQLNKTKIETNPWDQKMDLLVVRDGEGWLVKNI